MESQNLENKLNTSSTTGTTTTSDIDEHEKLPTLSTEPTSIEVTHEEATDANKYSLCGYLYKQSGRGYKSAKSLNLASHVTATRKRWFVYSGQTCKLYYYRTSKDPEPLGEIDIALATFSYNLESENSGEFIISCGGKDYVLEACSSKERLFWLRNLQNERREFNERLNFAKYKSTETSIGRLESGLLKDPDPLPPLIPDPLGDLINKSMDASINKSCSSTSPKTSKSNLNLPLNLFRTASSPLPNTDTDYCSISTHHDSLSEAISPLSTHYETNSMDMIGRRFRSSFKIKRPRFMKSTSDDAADVPVIKEKCKKCFQMQEELDVALEESERNKDNSDAFKEAVYLLQREVEVLQRGKSTLEHLSVNVTNDRDILAIFQEKDKRIVDLEHNKQKLTNSLAMITSNLRDSRIHSNHLEEKVTMLTGVIEVKNNAIVDLSQELERSTGFDSSARKLTRANSTFYSTSPLKSYPVNGVISIGTQTTNSDIESLKDILEGYKCQNTFLNKEILELNQIQKRRNEREQKLMSESSLWEAKFYQIQSKYLLLLNDLHSPQDNQHDSTVLSQLLQDVVNSQGSTDLRVVQKQGKMYDEYGFCMSAPGETDILSRAEFLQKQSKTFSNQAEHNRISSNFINASSWESLLIGTNAKELPQHPELKFLIREGIPYQYKGKVWRLLIESHIGKYKASLSPTYYEDLLAKRQSNTSTLGPSAKQIELDLLRTLPNNRHYESPYADGIPKLRRVLLAYSRHNLAVGYCQGLNRLAAIALLFLNEDDAFWCLVYIIEYLMPPDFYTRNLIGSQVDQRVLKDLIYEKLPKLSHHFEKHSLDISLFTFNWFLCIYIDAIPPSTYLYIWDSFLYEGTKVLFRFSIAIFKLCEESILEKNDYMAIFDYLRSVPEPVTDIKKLQQMAFHWANPLAMKHIRNRREYHRAVVKVELDEVEEVRKSYHVNKEPNPSEDDDEDSDDEKPSVVPVAREHLKVGMKDIAQKFGEIKDRGKKLVKHRFSVDDCSKQQQQDVKWIVVKRKPYEDDHSDDEVGFEDAYEQLEEDCT